MGRLLLALVSLAVLGFIAYKQVSGSVQGASTERSAPKQRLDNVREATKRIEVNDQKNADEMFKKTEPP